VHLVDLALWTLDFPAVTAVRGRLFAGGAPLADPARQVEDYAVAEIELAGGAVVRAACSWRLHAGREAVISAAFHGTAGGAEMRNLGGSFYDFAAEAHRGTAAEPLASPPDAWGGRAAVRWAERLAAGEGFDGAEGERLVAVADVLDRIYGR
jgi:predicted dehydrogenase